MPTLALTGFKGYHSNVMKEFFYPLSVCLPTVKLCKKHLYMEG